MISFPCLVGFRGETSWWVFWWVLGWVLGWLFGLWTFQTWFTRLLYSRLFLCFFPGRVRSSSFLQGFGHKIAPSRSQLQGLAEIGSRTKNPLGTNESGRTSARLGSVETPIDVPSHGNPWRRPVLDDPPLHGSMKPFGVHKKDLFAPNHQKPA